jgi:hypothetical protein
MTSNSIRRVFALCAITTLAGTQIAQKVFAQEQAPRAIVTAVAVANTPTNPGTIVGMVRNAAHAPVVGATVTVTRLDNHSIRSTMSSSEGIYSFSDVVPGTYSVTSQADGYTDAVISTVEVTSGKASTTNIAMAMPAPAPKPAAPAVISSNPGAANAAMPGTNQAPAQAAAAADKPDGLWSTLFKKAVTNDMTKPKPQPAPVTTASLSAPPVAAFDKPSPAPNPDVPTPAPAPAPQGLAAPAAAAPADAAAPAVGASPPPVDSFTPFADFDATWLNGNTRQHDSPLDGKYFSGEFRADTFYGEDFNQPIDHSMGGSSEVFRNGEVQLEDLSIGGDFHDGHMRGRVLMLFGMFSATTVRNDASPAVGQWDVRSAYKYVSEAYGGYHWNVQHGINVDAGIFVSYVGLFSYHNFDNWAYQPSYVSSNTPWFFNGVRIQWFPTNHLKIEPWIINGWQSYNKFNGHPGLGGQLKYTPHDWMTIILNQYGFGTDNVGLPKRQRYHTDDSVEIKYYEKQKPGYGIDRMAFTFTGDLGCESGQGVTCTHGHDPYNPITGNGGPKQAFLGYMIYDRVWWHHDLLAFTLGGGQMNNPGRYLTLVLPVNGADAISGTPYFPAAPGLPLKAYDGTATLDYMPSQFATFRLEFGYRHTNVPYWSGRGGITPPGGNNGSPADFVCASGASSGFTDLPDAETACGGGIKSVWFPDLREGQALLSAAIMVKF